MSDALKQAEELFEQAQLNSEWPMLGVNTVIICAIHTEAFNFRSSNSTL